MRSRLAFMLAGAFALAAALAVPAALSAQRPGEIALEGMRLSATDRPSCLLAGEWPGGAPLQYLAWDACAALTVRRVTLDDVRDARALGIDKRVTVADIPPGAPVVEVSNGASTVLLFPDADGVTREILIGD